MKLDPPLFCIIGLSGILAVALIVFYPTTQFSDNSIYVNFVSELSNKDKYNVITVSEYYSNLTIADKINVIIRHDSDFRLSQLFYTLEKDYGIKSTYYIRPNMDYYLKDIQWLHQIEKEGWEIGFHYDSLTRINFEVKNISNIDYAGGLYLFKYDLIRMRENFNVSSVASHGNYAKLDITNKWLVDKYPEEMTRLGVKEAYNIPSTRDFSDTNKRFSIDPLELLNSSQRGDILVFNFHSDYWR